MEIERADQDRIEVLGGKPGDKERYIKSDFRIRSGLIANGPLDRSVSRQTGRRETS